jgi:hypothetical protein
MRKLEHGTAKALFARPGRAKCPASRPRPFFWISELREDKEVKTEIANLWI